MATAAMVMNGMGRLFGGGTLAGRADAQLLESFLADRDESAFAALVARHGPMVLATCRAVLKDPAAADDAFQATFLVLARKAGSVRGQDALGGWLHRVAYRAAVQAARDGARRRLEERKAAEMRATVEASEGVRDDLRAAVHAEVERLPESLRLPVVLCDLEGRTREQAAEELRWTEWMVRGRLARGRAKLRHRLTVRGLAPSVGLGVGALAAESVAAVPEALAAVTVRSAIAAVAGRAAAPVAAGLAARVARSMLLDRVRSATVVAVATFAVAGTSLGLVMLPRPKGGDPQLPAMPKMTPPARDNQAKAVDAPKASPAELRKAVAGLFGALRGDKELSYKGVVVDPAGKPVAGAKVYLLFASGPEGPRTTSGPDGRFAFKASVPASAQQVRVAAEAEGFALGGASKGFAIGDFLDGPPDHDRDLTVRLVEDQKVDGRVVDLEGRPVAGASVRGEYLFVPKNGDIGPYLRALRAQEDAPDQLRNTYLWHAGLELVRKGGGTIEGSHLATTDADGRFVVKGLGRDRLVRLKIEGPTIRPLDVELITRPGEPIRAQNLPGMGARFGMRTFYGPSLQLAASPSRPVEGFVRDRETGAPVIGAIVSSYKLADQELGNNTIVRTTSDAKGHYRLAGMPRGSGNELMVIPPAGAPYLAAMVKLDDPPGLGPMAFDIPLYRGIVIEGRVLDEPTTGKPVSAWVHYHVAADNPALEAAPEFRQMQYTYSYELKASTDGQGRYKLVGLPGKGLLSVETMDRSHPDDGHPDISQGFVPIVQGWHQALVDIDVPGDAKTFSKDIRLDPGREVEGTVVDPEGKPLEGAEVYGLSNMGYWENLPRSSTFKVVALVPSRPSRAVVFIHEARKLAGWVEIPGNETGHPRVRLEPWAAVTGRMLDKDGKPRAGITLSAHAKKARLGGGSIDHKTAHVRTDNDGRFRVEGLAPGLGYELYARAMAGMMAERPVEVEPTKSGETRDLGNVTVAYRNNGQ